MTASLTTGYTFSTGDEVTAVRLNNLVNAATIADIARSDLSSVTKVITTGTSSPTSPSTGELWYDTTNGVLNVYNGTKWNGLYPYQSNTLTAQSALNAGDVVVIDTGNANSVDSTTSAASTEVVGVAVESVAGPPVSCVIATSGIVDVNVTGTTAVGDYLYTSTTAGQADPSATLGAGAFARALTADSGGACTAVLVTPPANTALAGSTTSSTFATHTYTNATVTDATWYDFAAGANGATITTDGSSGMELDFTTTVANQAVLLSVKNLVFQTTGIGTGTALMMDGFRVVVDGTAIVTFSFGQYADYETNNVPGAAGEQAILGPVTFYYGTNAATNGIIVPYFEFSLVVTTAGAHTFRPQFLSGRALTTDFSGNNNSQTATLAARILSVG